MDLGAMAMKGYSTPSDGLILYPRHSFGESDLSAKIQLVYSTAPAAWAVLPLDKKNLSTKNRQHKLNKTS